MYHHRGFETRGSIGSVEVKQQLRDQNQTDRSITTVVLERTVQWIGEKRCGKKHTNRGVTIVVSKRKVPLDQK